MSKLIVLQGPPAVGKSTWCKNFLDGLSKKERSKWIIVSRDGIRDVTGTYWVPDREDYISEVEEFMIDTALEKGYNVISDAMNLHPYTISRMKMIAELNLAEIEFIDIHVSLEENIKRDEQREGDSNSPRTTQGHLHVGREAIEKYYRKYYPDECK